MEKLSVLLPGSYRAQRSGSGRLRGTPVDGTVATYTRALQEQAMRHDVPLALHLLHEVRPDVRPRVGLLKGRANYLCWRGLCTHSPGPADDGLYHLSWTALALFALALKIRQL